MSPPLAPPSMPLSQAALCPRSHTAPGGTASPSTRVKALGPPSRGSGAGVAWPGPSCGAAMAGSATLQSAQQKRGKRPRFREKTQRGPRPPHHHPSQRCPGTKSRTAVQLMGLFGPQSGTFSSYFPHLLPLDPSLTRMDTGRTMRRRERKNGSHVPDILPDTYGHDSIELSHPWEGGVAPST